MNTSFVLKGNFIDCDENRKLRIYENCYGVCVEGVSRGIFEELPQEYAKYEVRECGDALILPGLVDLHVHAPQYGFRGIGFDCELIEWLNTHTFPVESRFADEDYAREAYEIFVEDLKNSATTRAVIFGTIHEKSTLLLMELLEKTGLKTYVGKVNMDRNSPDYYIEENVDVSIENTIRFIEEALQHFDRTKPIITPRFIPTCSDELMDRLAQLKKRYHLPVQSHLSENRGEIEWVKELCPQASCYGDAYDRSGILDESGTAIMAHCVYSGEEEMHLLKKKGVFVANCPKSNLNLMSGIAPIRKYIEEGVSVGLGSDVAGGENLSIFEEMAKAIQVSKMYWRYIDDTKKPLTVPEVLYLATRGGGAFFGKVGSFDAGYEFDAIIMDDSALKSQLKLNLEQRLERMVYSASQCKMTEKYVEGIRVCN